MFSLFFGEWWGALTNVEQIFWGISIVFSILFVIQFVLSLLAGFEFEGDIEFDSGADLESDYSLDTDFTILSVRSFIAFFTFFGWAGVSVLNSGGSSIMAAMIGTGAGFSAMFVVGYMMYLFSKLKEDGTIKAEDAIYSTGEVYLSIPAAKSGQGKIQVSINGSLREMDAITEGKSLPTGANIRVVDILETNVLVVEPVEIYLD